MAEELAVVPIEYVKETCKIGQGADCCCMLVVGGNGFECVKGSSLEPTILARRETMTAQAINCEGYKAEP